MNRRTAHAVLKTAFEAAGLNGKLATEGKGIPLTSRLGEHCEKVVAHGRARALQLFRLLPLGSATQRYLGVNYASVRDAVEKMAFTDD